MYSMHVYEVRPRKDKRGVDLISDALPFGRLWYGEPNAVDYAKFYSRSTSCRDSRLRHRGNVIETHEHAGDFGQCRDNVQDGIVYAVRFKDRLRALDDPIRGTGSSFSVKMSTGMASHSAALARS